MAHAVMAINTLLCSHPSSLEYFSNSTPVFNLTFLPKSGWECGTVIESNAPGQHGSMGVSMGTRSRRSREAEDEYGVQYHWSRSY